MLPKALRIFVATAPIDLRVSFDRLAGIVRDQFREDPRSGALFFFTNKAKDKCKVLFFDNSGYVQLYKRLDAGTFPVPAGDGAGPVSLDPEAFGRLLEGICEDGNHGPPRRGRPRVH